ncbi:hypothetical protein PR048_008132 [Dryococelus australis]|uniref:Uncharacterized protein n=1 Tax=Dryococelus australis TaxID=614101 RepID=A0ABQ9HX42_9NEOP|nr:hypothetical protein PR048_008132 [Dryococelus australis]
MGVGLVAQALQECIINVRQHILDQPGVFQRVQDSLQYREFKRESLLYTMEMYGKLVRQLREVTWLSTRTDDEMSDGHTCYHPILFSYIHSQLGYRPVASSLNSSSPNQQLIHSLPEFTNPSHRYQFLPQHIPLPHRPHKHGLPTLLRSPPHPLKLLTVVSSSPKHPLTSLHCSPPNPPSSFTTLYILTNRSTFLLSFNELHPISFIISDDL